ncbi:putative Kinesin-like protein KIN-5C [Cocos nucifera]|nr:putative Kinesin-like protein KIN-5C [Cocos nucifera]
MKEKDFIISKQRKAENALAHQACVLRSDLEKSIWDNASLFSKIAREDKLNAANRSMVNNFQADLAAKIGTLCNTVVAALDRQNEHLRSVEKLCQSSLDFHDKAISEVTRKVLSSRALYISHVEAVHNVVRLHKASSNASLEEVSSMISTNSCSLDQLLAFGEGEADQIFGDLQRILSNHRGEIAHFTHELREKFQVSSDRTREMSKFILGLLDRIGEETKEFQNDTTLVHEAQVKSIAEFRKAYEEQSRSEEEKLLTDITNLVSNHMRRQKELVDVRLSGLGDAAQNSKLILDNHASSMDIVTTDAKRKWEEFSKQAEQDSKDGSNISAAKHCRMELLLQQCTNTADAASQQWKKTHASVSEMSSKHVAEMEALVRSAIESNEQHDVEVASARTAAEEDVAKNSMEVLQHFDSVMDHERNSASAMMEAVEAHSATLQKLQEEHSSQATYINRHAESTFQNDYTDYEPTGETPVRSEPDVPSKGTIESLRAMPTEALLEEFRENHPYESAKEPKPSLIPRSPLIQLN